MAGFIATGINKDRWLLEVKDIFSDNNFTQVKYTPSFNIAFRELTRIYKEHTSAWWEVQSLNSYITNNIVPRGLRITLAPANRCRNPTFMANWEREATCSSIKFMHLLLEEEKTRLTSLDTQLQEQIEITKKFENESEYVAKEKLLEGTLERFQFHLKDRKHKQFIRDSLDFKENRAYSFAPRVPHKEVETELSSTETDFSDTDRENTGRGYRTYNRRRGGRGRNRGNKSRGRGQEVFLDQPHPYHLRDRNPPSTS